MPKFKSMRIVQLTVQNVKKIAAVAISPDRRVIEITGPNEAGKTSVLDAIWWALGGGDAIQSMPIREGQDNARIEISLGDDDGVELIVERRWTKASTYLYVTTPEGARFQSPQSILDRLVGKLTFDPFAFCRLPAKDQREMLRKVAGIDTAKLDGEHEQVYAERRDLGRDLKRAETMVDGYPRVSDKPAPGDEAAAEAALNDARGQERARQACLNALGAASDLLNLRKAQAHSAASALEMATRALELAERQDKEAKAAFEAAQAQLAELEAAPLPDLPDLDAAELRVRQARQANLRLREWELNAQAVEKGEAEVAKLKADITARTERLAAIAEEKAKLVAAAPMPVDGLGLTDDGVVFKGVPLDQVSEAKRLIISAGIAAALNPKIRIIRIEHGSLLDSKSLAALEKFAEEQNMQVWLEVVDETGERGIPIEDGYVKGMKPAAEQPAKPAEQAALEV